MSCQTHSYLDTTKNRTSTYFACMYGMLYGMAWPDLQHESMVWYGMMASLPYVFIFKSLDAILKYFAYSQR